MRPVRLCVGRNLFCSLFSSGSSFSLNSCDNCSVSVVSYFFYYNSGVFECYCSIGVCCLSFLV